MLLPAGDRPAHQRGLQSLRFVFPQPGYRLYALAWAIADAIAFGDACLLWVTEYGVWPSSENTHLYYRLRASYGDQRVLHETPGHLCQKHEREDLATFLQLTMLFGWGAYLLPATDYVAAFCSHDEWLEFYARDQEVLADVEKRLAPLKLKPASKTSG